MIAEKQLKFSDNKKRVTPTFVSYKNNCCAPQSYKCEVLLKPIWKSAHKYIGVDKCLKDEILWLWDQEIITSLCCCGHNGFCEPVIMVEQECVEKMKQLGYQEIKKSLCGEPVFKAKTEILNFLKKGIDFY